MSKKTKLETPVEIIMRNMTIHSSMPYSKKGDLFESHVIDDPADEDIERLINIGEVTYQEHLDDDTYIIAVKLDTQEACQDFLEWGIENGYFDDINQVEYASPGFIEACGMDPDEVNDFPARVVYSDNENDNESTDNDDLDDDDLDDDLDDDINDDLDENNRNNDNGNDDSLNEDSSSDVDAYWDKLVSNGIATDDEVKLALVMNGYTVETLDRVLYARTGYHNWNQYAVENGLDSDDEINENDNADNEVEHVRESVSERFAKYRALFEGDDEDENSDDNDDDNVDNDNNTSDSEDDSDNEDDEEVAITSIIIKVATEDVDKCVDELKDAGISEDDIEVLEKDKDSDDKDKDEDDSDNEDDNDSDDSDVSEDETEIRIEATEENVEILTEYLDKKGINLEDELGGSIDKGDSDSDDNDSDNDDSDDNDDIPDFDTDFFNDLGGDEDDK